MKSSVNLKHKRLRTKHMYEHAMHETWKRECWRAMQSSPTLWVAWPDISFHNICRNVDKADKIKQSIRTEYLRSWGATILIFIRKTGLRYSRLSSKLSSSRKCMNSYGIVGRKRLKELTHIQIKTRVWWKKCNTPLAKTNARTISIADVEITTTKPRTTAPKQISSWQWWQQG